MKKAQHHFPKHGHWPDAVCIGTPTLNTFTDDVEWETTLSGITWYIHEGEIIGVTFSYRTIDNTEYEFTHISDSPGNYTEFPLKLHPGEYITSFKGTHGTHICSVDISTNAGMSFRIGTKAAFPFQIGIMKGFTIQCFSGSLSDTGLSSLSASFHPVMLTHSARIDDRIDHNNAEMTLSAAYSLLAVAVCVGKEGIEGMEITYVGNGGKTRKKETFGEMGEAVDVLELDMTEKVTGVSGRCEQGRLTNLRLETTAPRSRLWGAFLPPTFSFTCDPNEHILSLHPLLSPSHLSSLNLRTSHRYPITF